MIVTVPSFLQTGGSSPAGAPLSCAAVRLSPCSAGCSWPAAQRWSVSAGSSGAESPVGGNARSEASPPRSTHAPAAHRKNQHKDDGDSECIVLYQESEDNG